MSNLEGLDDLLVAMAKKGKSRSKHSKVIREVAWWQTYCYESKCPVCDCRAYFHHTLKATEWLEKHIVEEHGPECLEKMYEELDNMKNKHKIKWQDETYVLERTPTGWEMGKGFHHLAEFVGKGDEREVTIFGGLPWGLLKTVIEELDRIDNVQKDQPEVTLATFRKD